MRVIGKLQELVQDPLFWRVTACLIGLPFVYLGVWGAIGLMPAEGWWWLGVTLLGALSLYGGFLVYAACFGSDKLFERAIGLVHDGGDLLALVLIVVGGLAAIPITMVLRSLRPRQS